MPVLRLRTARSGIAHAAALLLGASISTPGLFAAPYDPPEPFPSSTAVPAPAEGTLRQLPIRAETLPNLPQSPKARVADSRSSAAADAPERPSPEDVAEKPNAEHVVERYEDGSIRVDRWVALNERGSFVNHGRWEEFDREGNIIASGSWNLGRREGLWFKQISQAALAGLGFPSVEGFVPPFRSTATFRDGQLDGDWEISDGLNRIVALWHYEDGRRNGPSVWYDPDGDKRLQVNYDDDLPSGESLSWPNGPNSEPRRVTYGDGMALETRVQWFPGARGERKKQETAYLVPSTLGIVAHSWEANRIEFAPVQDAEPIQHGPVRSWHENGVPAEKGQYALGSPHGQFHWWYPTGQPKAVGSFQDGQPHDKWVWWHENGMRRAEGEFASGNRVGTWREWNEQGQLLGPGDSTESQVAEKHDAAEEPSSRRRTPVAATPRRGVSRQ